MSNAKGLIPGAVVSVSKKLDNFLYLVNESNVSIQARRLLIARAGGDRTVEFWNSRQRAAPAAN